MRLSPSSFCIVDSNACPANRFSWQHSSPTEPGAHCCPSSAESSPGNMENANLISRAGKALGALCRNSVQDSNSESSQRCDFSQPFASWCSRGHYLVGTTARDHRHMSLFLSHVRRSSYRVHKHLGLFAHCGLLLTVRNSDISLIRRREILGRRIPYDLSLGLGNQNDGSTSGHT